MSLDNSELIVGIFALALVIIVLWVAALDKQVSQLMTWRYERDAERLRERERRSRL